MNQAIVIGIITGSVYGLFALGLALIYKSSGVFNFAQGEFGTVGVFFLYLARTWHYPYLIAILVGLLASVLMGVLTERLVVRPLFDAARVTLLVATAGVALLAIGVEGYLGGFKPYPLEPALPRLNRVSVFGVYVSDQRLLILVVLAVLAASLWYFFSRTSLGLAVLAASQEPVATELMGISVRRISTFTWGLAGLLGGVAGILSAPIAGFAPGFLTIGNSSALIPGFTAAVIGGFTSLPGAFLGGFIVGVAQTMAVTLDVFRSVPGAGSVLIFGLLLAVLLVRPRGLLGRTA